MTSTRTAGVSTALGLALVLLLCSQVVHTVANTEKEALKEQTATGEAQGKNETEEAQVVEHCSRQQSRLVRYRLNEFFYPTVEREGYTLPIRCPLRKELDFVREHEESKSSSYQYKWKCKRCGKAFKGEKYLDKHLANKHPFTVEEITGKVCLADFADVTLHVPLTGAHLNQHPDDREYENWLQEQARVNRACSPAKMEERRFRCQAVLYRCFPADDGPLANQLHELFYKQFCSKLVCASGGSAGGGMGAGGTGGGGVGTQRNAIPSTREGVFQRLHLAMVVIVVLVLVAFYLGYYFYYREVNLASELQRLRESRHSLRNSLFGRKKKVKAY